MFSVHLYSAVIHVDSHMLTALGEDDGEREERENWVAMELGAEECRRDSGK